MADGDAPEFVNRDHGVAMWENQTEDGDTYYTVQLPLGLGRVNLFQNDQ